MPNKTSEKNREPVKTLIETAPMNRVIELLKSDIIDSLRGNKAVDDWNVHSFNILMEFYQSNGVIKRHYRKGINDEAENGRLYADYGMGYQFLRSDLRGYLCQDDYIDIDIENCHPHILLEIMKSRGFDYKLLEDYIENKDQWREMYPGIKGKIIQQINDKVNQREVMWDKPNRLLSQIYQFVRFNFNEMDNECHKKPIWIEMARIENELLMRIVKVAEEMKVIVNSLIFDGLIVKKCDHIKDFIARVNQTIAPYRVTIKPWKVPRLNVINTDRFDYGDKTNIQDLLKLSGRRYPSLSHFQMEALPLMNKTARFVGKTVLTKLNLSSIGECYHAYKSIKRIDSFVIFYGPKNRQADMSDLLVPFRSLISYNSATPLRETKSGEFSIDCGFLCEYDELPEDWQERVNKFKNHILTVNSCGDERIANGFYYFYANVIQTNQLCQTIMVTTGLQGVGKSIIPTMIIKKILGRKGLIVSNLNDITSKFNGHLGGIRLVLVNEMSNIDSKQKNADCGILKNIVDTPILLIEPKGLDRMTVPNMLEIVGCSNHKHCVSQAEGMERRNFVIEADTKYQNDHKYFNDLIEYLDDPKNIRSIYEFLRTYDISDKNTLKNLPTTSTKALGIFKAMHPVLKAVLIAIRSNTAETVKIKRGELYDLMRRYNLIGTITKIKMAEYVKDQLADKITITNPKNILTYEIHVERFQYPEEVMNIISDYMYEIDHQETDDEEL